MTLYPEVQAKAQAEIDTVVGSTRLPHFSDRHQLPYVDAVLKEVYRFGMILPMGVQHRLRIDDIHHDYVVPKNTWVFPNIWYFRTFTNIISGTDSI
jgi:cytochrome P450